MCADNNRPGGTEEEYNEWSLFPNRCAFFNVSGVLGLLRLYVRATAWYAAAHVSKLTCTCRNALWLKIRPLPCYRRLALNTACPAAQSQCRAPIPALPLQCTGASADTAAYNYLPLRCKGASTCNQMSIVSWGACQLLLLLLPPPPSPAHIDRCIAAAV